MCSKTRGRCALIGPPYGCLSPAPPEDPPPKLDNETEREEKGEKKQIRESSERENSLVIADAGFLPPLPRGAPSVFRR